MNATMPGPCDTLIEDGRWREIDLPALADRAAGATLASLGLDPAGFEISLLACDDDRIAALNADFRGSAQPTNVLSWPSEERAAAVAGQPPVVPEGDSVNPLELGDIAIAYDTCAAEATARGKRLSDHATHLIVHATLHLLGYDHIEDPDAALMEGLEARVLAGLGVDDPYLVTDE
jgi:probable rRNA maturation factor